MKWPWVGHLGIGEAMLHIIVALQEFVHRFARSSHFSEAINLGLLKSLGFKILSTNSFFFF